MRLQVKEIFQIVGLFVALIPGTRVDLGAQTATSAAPTASVQEPSDTTRTRPAMARVYIECDACDRDYLQQEMTFVSLVRDRLLANVSVLVTSLDAASGGRVFSVQVLTVNNPAPAGDTLTVSIRPDATSIEERQAIVRTIKVALLPFVISVLTPEHFTIQYEPPPTARTNARRNDPWNQWVFRLGASGSMAADDNYTSRSGEGSASASRITNALKVELSARGSVNRETFRLEDDKRVVSVRQNWSVRSLVVHSIGDHLSAGTRASIASSMFQNTRRDIRLQGAIEYDYYSYRDATQRQLIARYSIGLRSATYVDTTVYGRIAESRPIHDFTVASDIRQPWGNIYGSAVWSQYLHDRRRNRLSIFGGVDYRIVAGLNTNFSVNYARIRDQLNIPGSNLTDQERLLQLRELQSGYSFSTYVGLSYTFGSVFNSVVNPRFRL